MSDGDYRYRTEAERLRAISREQDEAGAKKREAEFVIWWTMAMSMAAMGVILWGIFG